MNKNYRAASTAVAILLCIAYLGFRAFTKADPNAFQDGAARSVSAATMASGDFKEASDVGQALAQDKMPKAREPNTEAGPSTLSVSKTLASGKAQNSAATTASSSLNDVRRLTEMAMAENQKNLIESEERLTKLTEAVRAEKKNHDDILASAKRIKNILRDLPLQEAQGATPVGDKPETPLPKGAAIITPPNSAQPPELSTAKNDSTNKPVVASGPASEAQDSGVEQIVQAVNLTTPSPIANVTAADAKHIHLAFNGGAMLLTDRHHPRISQLQLSRLKPLINEITAHHIESVTVHVAATIPEAHLNTLVKFIRRQYGWEPVIDRVSPQALNTASREPSALSLVSGQLFPLQIDIVSQR